MLAPPDFCTFRRHSTLYIYYANHSGISDLLVIFVSIKFIILAVSHGIYQGVVFLHDKLYYLSITYLLCHLFVIFADNNSNLKLSHVAFLSGQFSRTTKFCFFWTLQNNLRVLPICKFLCHSLCQILKVKLRLHFYLAWCKTWQNYHCYFLGSCNLVF